MSIAVGRPVATVVLGALLATGLPALSLTLEERIVQQGAIEHVYHRHRIWTGDPAARPRFEAAVPPAALRAKVEDVLRKSRALEVEWQRPVTPEELHAEVLRIERDSKDPELLAELEAALGNDPVLIAECVARPLLVERRIRSLFASDARIHGPVRERAAAAMAEIHTLEQMRARPEYEELLVTRTAGRVPAPHRPGEIALAGPAFDGLLASLEAELGGAVARPPAELREEDARLVALTVIARTPESVRLGSLSWPKRSFDDWWTTASTGYSTSVVSTSASDASRWRIGRGPSSACSSDSWTPTSSGEYVPAARVGHEVVWTGSEMIVWGGYALAGNVDSGGRYTPATDTWAPTSLANAPRPRISHTVVWTGSEMIVWGGVDSGTQVLMDTGGRYDPATDRWVDTSLAGAPSARAGHSAVWTGAEMVVWGGYDYATEHSTGGAYDPTSDSWTATGTANVPAGRYSHTAVWTGSEMIVWGGDVDNDAIDSGGRYDPATGSWTVTSMTNVPAGRSWHTAVWTGSEMIVWGGEDISNAPLNTGARYDPQADSWTATSMTSAPERRVFHAAVWTGSEMIVWGGEWSGGNHGSGGRYDPSLDRWVATNGAGAPSKRSRHTAVWSGSEMIVWGGGRASMQTDTGGRYSPATDSWTPTKGRTIPVGGRWGHTAVWTGSEMIVWGGMDITAPAFQGANSGGRYSPATDSWLATSRGANVPEARTAHTAVWTGAEMIVWGGYYFATSSGEVFNSGGRYDPVLDAWTPTSVGAGVPVRRESHSAVWTGDEMIVWGGGFNEATGGRYDPTTDSWRPTTLQGAPEGRLVHSAVWTGSEMIVWGGGKVASNALRTGGRYDPVRDAWWPTSLDGPVPAQRWGHAAVWTGHEMIIWGGDEVGNLMNTGSRYDPAADSWTAMAGGANLPTPRTEHTGIWTGRELIVWGGNDPSGSSDSGGRYDLESDAWSPLAAGAPSRRHDHSAVWTGRRMIVWGGSDDRQHLYTGGAYCAELPGGNYVVGEGLGDGPGNTNRVRVYRPDGTATTQDYQAYGAGKWGTNVATGDVDGDARAEVLTGPGPGAVYGPHVRGFDSDGAPMTKVSFHAYGTLRYGVNVAGGDVDGDPSSEIVTGAGPGAVFGPHVRGFELDGAQLQAMANVSFFAYGTLKYGVNVASGDVDRDAVAELLTGPGPGDVFAPTVRGFEVRAGGVGSIAKINYDAFTGRFGVNVASGDADEDGADELAAARGPGSTNPAELVGHDYDGSAITALPGFTLVPWSTLYGARVGLADILSDDAWDLLAGQGRDPGASSEVRAYAYAGGALTQLPGSGFLPFQTTGYGFGVNVAGGALGQ